MGWFLYSVFSSEHSKDRLQAPQFSVSNLVVVVIWEVMWAVEACITRSLQFTSIQLVQECFKYLVLIRFQVSPPQPPLPPSPSPLTPVSLIWVQMKQVLTLWKTSCTKNEVSSWTERLQSSGPHIAHHENQLILHRLWLQVNNIRDPRPLHASPCPSSSGEIWHSCDLWQAHRDYRLPDRKTTVRLENCVSGTLMSSTGATQGTVLALSPFTSRTADFKYHSESCHIQKHSDDTAIVVLTMDRILNIRIL